MSHMLCEAHEDLTWGQVFGCDVALEDLHKRPLLRSAACILPRRPSLCAAFGRVQGSGGVPHARGGLVDEAGVVVDAYHAVEIHALHTA
jgi:hypothetical protein